MVKEIDSNSLRERLATGEDLHVVDIRSEAEVAYGTLPNATHVPMHLLPLRLTEFPKDKELVLYCRSGARSFHACAFLLTQGFRKVINLRGGIMDWSRHGFKVASAYAE